MAKICDDLFFYSQVWTRLDILEAWSDWSPKVALLDAGNKSKSVPTSWFMAVTANPPREFDKFTLCCQTCATTKETAGCGTDERIMTRYRADAWILYHGRNVRGHCYHCGPESRKMHVLLTAWHAGHDIPDSKNGSREATNMAPLHAGCNRDQGVETFKEYQEDY